MRIVQIVTCVKILYLEKKFSLGCVTVRFYRWENIVCWRLHYFWKVLFSLRICIHLINKLHCNFAFSVETFGTVKNCVTWKLRYCEKLRYLETALLWKTALLENCVTLKNCVTWKLCYFEKLRYLKTVFFEKLRYLKTVLFWKLRYLKTVFFEKLRYSVKKRCCLIIISLKLRWLGDNCFYFRIVYNENWTILRESFALGCVTLKIALGCVTIKYCVRVRYF